MKRSYLFLFLLLASLVFSSPILAADSTSFDPTKVMVQSIGAIPVGTVITWPSNSWPSDKDNWLECNGQSISSTVYPELVAVVGSTVPDYRGRFLRGVSSGHFVGEKVANSIKSHNHTQPAHTHSFSGQLVSTALSGTAAGQRYLDEWTGIGGSGSGDTGPVVRRVYGLEGITTETDWTYKDSNYKYANSSSVSGNLKNGTVAGTIGQGGGDPTDYTGGSETAPDHIYVRCLIRAKP